MTIEIPYYERKTAYGMERLRMPFSREAQEIKADELAKNVQKIQRVYDVFDRLRELKATAQLPIDFRKAPSLVKGLRMPEPNNKVVRLDMVDGQIVDINNKPAGLGLTLAAEERWQPTVAYPIGAMPIIADLEKFANGFGSLAVVTEGRYPFSSDQKGLATALREGAGIKCEVIDPTRSDPESLEGYDAVFCFSYLESYQIDPEWRKWIRGIDSNVLVSPVKALFWDNKALMALPFLKLELSNKELESQLLSLKEVFPKTYVFTLTERGELQMFTALSDNKAFSQTVEMNSLPEEVFKSGKVYIKPLGESGGRGVVVKNFQDKGGAFSSISKYVTQGGIVVQKAVSPQATESGFIKDGYFFDASTREFITIERMQQPSSGEKIHGGSKTSLVPVYTRY